MNSDSLEDEVLQYLGLPKYAEDPSVDGFSLHAMMEQGYRCTFGEYRGCALMNVIFGCGYAGSGQRAAYTLNLKTGKPTKNSELKTELPADLIDRLRTNWSESRYIPN